ncbi:MAG: hypothetical protein ACRC7N_03035 [Clostridium sp.]
MRYDFDDNVASEVGVNGAIILKDIEGMIKWHEYIDNQNFFLGRFWMNSSYEDFTGTFPFWTTSQVRRIINKLLNEGYIISAIHKKNEFDRTKYYTLTKKYYDLVNGIE